MTLRKVMLSLGVLGMAFSATVGVAGWLGLDTLGRDMDAATTATTATRAITLGDMMHDALRGDV